MLKVPPSLRSLYTRPARPLARAATVRLTGGRGDSKALLYCRQGILYPVGVTLLVQYN